VKPARLLLVDDSPVVLAEVGRSLREAGHLVTSTNSGGDALAILASKPPPDLLLLDIGLPGIDGHGVLKQLDKELAPVAPPVIVITGSLVKPEDFTGGHVKRVLTKPFDQTAILTAVADVLAGGIPPAPDPEEPPSRSAGGA
jgi:CheY-like chemotaxis protein